MRLLKLLVSESFDETGPFNGEKITALLNKAILYKTSSLRLIDAKAFAASLCIESDFYLDEFKLRFYFYIIGAN